jgi:3'-5' exonuclease
VNKEKLFYFDCEWVPITENMMDLKMDYPLLDEAFTHQCEKWNSERLRNGDAPKGPADWWEEKAHFYPEFCKIICVSYGYFAKGEFQIKSVYGDDEKKLLSALPDLFTKVEKLGFILCGYAIKRFDMPWLSKRMMANGIMPSKNLCMYGKKPWEVEVFDLPEVWGQGNMQESYTPFELACAAIGMASSKEDLSGSKVKEAYWNGQIERIKTYCELDVLKTMELATKLIELLP